MKQQNTTQQKELIQEQKDFNFIYDKDLTRKEKQDKFKEILQEMF